MTSFAELLSKGMFRGQDVPLKQRTIPPPWHSSAHTTTLRGEHLWPRLHRRARSGGDAAVSALDCAFSKQGCESGTCMFNLSSAEWLEGIGAAGNGDAASWGTAGEGGSRPRMVIVKVSGVGTKVREGTLQLTPHTALVFDGSADTDVELKDIQFIGAAPAFEMFVFELFQTAHGRFKGVQIHTRSSNQRSEQNSIE